MKITSPAFQNGKFIPQIYSCKGDDINPELRFENIPPSTKTLALVLDDPDAPSGIFTHWVVFNMPPETMHIPQHSTPPGMQAKNSGNQNKYIGPCPPSGTHRYFFKLYALDIFLDASEISNKLDLMNSMDGHILEQAELMGMFSH